MSRRLFGVLSVGAAFLLGALVVPSHAQAGNLEEHLRELSKNKTWLVLRGFYAANRLRYDHTGALRGNSASGDWTADGIVQLDDFHFHHGRIVLQAQRAAAFFQEKEFH